MQTEFKKETEILETEDEEKSAMNRTIKLSINKLFVNKEEVTAHKNRSFNPFEGTISEFAAEINKGHAFCVELTSNSRCDKNFKSASFVALDFDGGSKLEEIKQNEFVKKYGTIIYTTPNHGKGGKDRFRVIFVLEEAIESANEYKKLIKSILKLFPQADQACSDVTRFYFGSKDSNPEIYESYLDKEKTKELINSYTETVKPVVSLEEEYKPTKEDVEEMLGYIPAISNYETWRNIVWAVFDALEDQETTIEIIEKWSPDFKHKGMHLKDLVRRACNRTNDKITAKTLLWHATKHGYNLQTGEISQSNPGHVAAKYLFHDCIDYITIAEELYEYKDGYYQKINEQELKSLITHFFDSFIDEKGDTPLARPKCVDEAYKYILRKTYVDQDKVNPAGINVKNGYLHLTYDEKLNPKFEIIAHSPEYYFTYKAEFEYNEKASSEIFDNVMDAMLDKDSQQILFRILASSFDLREMRKRHSRAVKLLMLYGQGSNGKDTLKEWIECLYAGLGITALPLQAFRAADGSREFSLSCLATSKVNWSSENAVVALDSCQTLKNFVTGDSMKVEEKYKSPMIIKPNAVGIFNINELPYIGTTSEAITSRYAIIHFKYSFVNKKQEDCKENERVANPRLKEDKEFVITNILPALLNRLIKEFENALKNGIDYSSMEALLDRVKEDTSHLYQYIQDAKISLCFDGEGIHPQELLSDYHRWCTKNGLVELNEENKFRRAIHNDKFDKIIAAPTEITKRFKKFFPELETTRNREGRFLNLKIGNPTKLSDIY